MRELTIVRHGHAISQTHGLKDHERPLSPQGREEVNFTSKSLKEKGFIPDKIICSTALRTRQTAEIFADNFSLTEKDIYWEGLLYSFYNETDFTNLLETYTPDNQKVCVIGHNPLLAEMISFFSGTNIILFSPASCAVIEFDIDNWKNMMTKKGKIKFFLSR